jgi:hypothetical protein
VQKVKQKGAQGEKLHIVPCSAALDFVDNPSYALPL